MPCLNSHEAIRRQILWFDSWMKPFSGRWDVIVVDDGSEPAISIASPTNFNATVIRISPHQTKWTQTRARNTGARFCPKSEFLFFADVDHILTPEALAAADSFTGDMLRFPRKTGALDENGKLLTSREDLLRFGATPPELGPPRGDGRPNATVCLVRRTIQETIGGFNEIFCGQYGIEGTEYKKRYERNALDGKCKPPELSPASIYAFPNPRDNHQDLFHFLDRKTR